MVGDVDFCQAEGVRLYAPAAACCGRQAQYGSRQMDEPPGDRLNDFAGADDDDVFHMRSLLLDREKIFMGFFIPRRCG